MISLSTLKNNAEIRWKATIDLSMTHACILAVWLGEALLRLGSEDLPGARELLRDFGREYLLFWPVSLLYPLGLAVAGAYDSGMTRTRTRAMRAAAGASMAGLVYVTLQLATTRGVGPELSFSVGFALLAVLVLPGARVVKQMIISRYRIALRRPPARVQPPQTVLVVGGAGYIGSMLVRRLLADGYHVRVLDKFVYGPRALRDVFGHHRLELIEGDCRNIKHVVRSVSGADAIVHLAAIVGDPACELNPLATLEINYAATRMLIEVAKGNGIRRFVFASSCSVYGATEEVVDERAPALPISLYGRTKVDSEQALIEAADADFEPTILRLATVFGHSYRPRFDLVVNLLTAKAFQERLITIYNGQQWRPFIHVADVADAIMLMLGSRQKLGGEIFNVGDNRMNFTLSSIAEKIQDFFPQARIEQMENSDRRNYRVAFDKIEKTLGFRSRWTLEDGILQMKHELDAGHIEDYRDPYYSNQKFLANAGIPRHAQDTDANVMAAFANHIPLQRHVNVAS